jgi:streptogramin lyase
VRSLVPKLLVLVAVIAALLALAASAVAAPAVTGTFNVGHEFEANNKIVAGPDGNMWFTLGNGKDVGKITPAGVVSEYDLEGVEGATGIAPGPEGKMWVPTTGKVTSFSPADPEGTDETFETATINAEGQIVAGPDGLMWVASLNALAHFSPADPEGTATKVPVVTEELTPFDIDVAGSSIVVADKGPEPGKSRIATFTTTGTEKDYGVPDGPQGLAGAPTGQIAYSAPLATPEQAGLITPPGPAQSFELVGDPFGVAYGSDQAFWIVDFAAGGLTRLTTAGQKSFLPGLPKESARQVGAGPGNTLWVTLTKKEGLVEVSAIAKITGLEPPVPPATPAPPAGNPPSKVIPQTKVGKGPKGTVRTSKPRATVKFSFSSPTAGSTFQCALTHGTKTKKGKLRFGVPKFKACKAPKKYTVGPGSYRFEVRALGTGGIDPTPAKRSFRVISTPN